MRPPKASNVYEYWRSGDAERVAPGRSCISAWTPTRARSRRPRRRLGLQHIAWRHPIIGSAPSESIVGGVPSIIGSSHGSGRRAGNPNHRPRTTPSGATARNVATKALIVAHVASTEEVMPLSQQHWLVTNPRPAQLRWQQTRAAMGRRPLSSNKIYSGGPDEPCPAAGADAVRRDDGLCAGEDDGDQVHNGPRVRPAAKLMRRQ